jgi:alpha-beta hydrolase superfamily lysophospholipase
MPPALPPGTWPSPLTAAAVAAGGVVLGPVAVTDGGRTVWWTESRPAEGGRSTVLRRTGDGPTTEVLPRELDARTRVHEYGGRSWAPLEGEGLPGGLVTSSQRDQRLWRVTDGVAVPLTAETSSVDRYGDPLLLPGGTYVLCVRERVTWEQVSHGLVAVPLDGSAEVVDLWTGSDFVAAAAVSPGGGQLAFVTWDHPRMPWDGTELRVAPLLPGPSLGPARVVLGGPEESVLAPSWDGDDAVCAATDRSGWWNLARVGLDGGDPEPLWPVEEDCGHPQWSLGWRSHVPLARGRVALLHSGRLAVRAADGTVTDVAVPFDTWLPWLATDGDVLVGVATSGVRRPAVVAVDTAAGTWREVAGPQQPDPAWAAVPQRRTLPSADGRTVHAVLYPPTSPDAELPDGVAPPAVLLVHGGPTAAAVVQYRPEVAFFTSRGFAVVDVDHTGSTGYGRAYRQALRGQWGVVDVEDCEAVARALLEQGEVSAVVVRGGSAGGFTVLAALTRGDSPFAAGTSYYGVADLLAMRTSTHDFESRYLDGLLGPLPEAERVWVERSPVTHAGRLDRPVLLLQGLDDPVVPPAQAELFLDALASRGVPHAYLAFEGEAHGFRRAETVAAALEAELSFYGQVLGFEPRDVPRLKLRGG